MAERLASENSAAVAAIGCFPSMAEIHEVFRWGATQHYSTVVELSVLVNRAKGLNLKPDDDQNH